MKKLLALLAVFATAAAFAADQVPLFNATLSMGKEHRFVLVSQPEGKASSFLRLGESFAGYALKTYDAKTGVLELERAGKIVKVTLMADAAVASAPVAVPATIADAEAVINKLHFEEMMTRAMAQQKKMLAQQFQRMAGQMASRGVDPAEVAAFQQKLTDEVFSVLDPQALKADVTRIYSEVFTKDELDGMSAFYSTPLGQVVATKQADVQEKLGVIVQGRMMEVMPKIQKMGQEFGQQQAAKRAAAAGVAPAPAPQPGKQ